MNHQLRAMPMTTPAVTVLPTSPGPSTTRRASWATLTGLACFALLSSFVHAAPWTLKLPEKLASEWQKIRASKTAVEAVKLVEQRLAALATSVPKIEESLAAMPAIPFPELVDKHRPAADGQVLAPSHVFDLLRPEFPEKSFGSITLAPQTKAVLLQVLRYAAKDANQAIGERAFLLAAGSQQQAAPAMRIALVLPFLCIDDADWDEDDIRALPKWLVTRLEGARKATGTGPEETPSARAACEHFALSVNRVGSAWAFHRFATNPPKEQSLTQYLEEKARTCFAGSYYREAGICLSAAAARSEADKDREAAARLRLALARSMAKLGCPADAAKEALHVVKNYADTAAGARAVLPRVHYLFQDEKFAAVGTEAETYGKDPRFAPCRPQLLYARWLASVRLRKPEDEDRLRQAYLAEFAKNPLTAEMYYFLVCQSLAVADMDAANEYMDKIAAEFPESRVMKPVQGIRQRIASEQEKIARQEKRRAELLKKPVPAP